VQEAKPPFTPVNASTEAADLNQN